MTSEFESASENTVSNMLSTLIVSASVEKEYLTLTLYPLPVDCYLTHWDQDKIDDILQTTFSNAFS